MYTHGINFIIGHIGSFRAFICIACIAQLCADYADAMSGDFRRFENFDYIISFASVRWLLAWLT
jgi:hypothetical protein